jgi:hypothetical protein
MTKGDADKKKQMIADKFTSQHKAGDIVFCYVYNYCKVLKVNKNTATCIQTDQKGNPIPIRGKVTPIVIEKYLFKVD